MKDWEAPWNFQYESEMNRELMPDEITSRWVVEKLNETHESPFFIVAGMNRPHTPRYAPKEFFDLFPLETISLPPYLENDLNDTPSILWENSYQSSALKRFLKDSAETDIGSEMWWKKWVQSYLACVAFIDHQVGVILDSLENSQYADNTIVIFTADHGYHMGEKNFLSKTTIWEESTRVPFVVYAPGVSVAGKKVAHPISLIDLYPTLIDLSALPQNPNIAGNGHLLDGHSIRPFLENPTSGTWNGPPVALNHLHGKVSPAKDTPSPIEDNHHSVRSNRYRYTLTSDGKEEFYDHLNDPNEWTNLAMTDLDDDVRSLMEWHKLELFKLLNISTLNINNSTKSPKFNIYQSNSGASNRNTKIEYTLSKDTQVSIEVYDVNGKKLLQLVDEFKPAGMYNISFSSSNLPKGLYFCKITSSMISQTIKMILSH
jgi:arylsulfatase A-like enzyme